MGVPTLQGHLWPWLRVLLQLRPLPQEGGFFDLALHSLLLAWSSCLSCQFVPCVAPSERCSKQLQSLLPMQR
jgi:hypothetical protein